MGAYAGALLLACASLLSACSRPAPPPEPVRSVKVMTVAATTAHSGHEFAGELRPQVEARLGFRVAGKLSERPAMLGQRVQPGQVLAQLDGQDLGLAAEAARAQVAAATTQRDLAAADAQRFRELKGQGFISGAELQRRESQLTAAQAQLEQAQAQRKAQGNQASYATLRADMAGVVTAVEAEPGQVLAAGTPVLRVALDGPRDAVFAVPEDQLGALRVGTPVTVKAWASEVQYPARVREVAASADPVTRTFTVKAGLEGAAAPALGSTLVVRPQAQAGAGQPVIKLPTSALLQHGQGSAVWVLEPASMTVQLQPVQIASADGNEVVLAGGLTPGQQVVTAGVHVLAPGQQVSLYQPRPTAAPLAGK